jgi:hypothetical protein
MLFHEKRELNSLNLTIESSFFRPDSDYNYEWSKGVKSEERKQRKEREFQLPKTLMEWKMDK